MDRRVELIWASRSQLQPGQQMQQHYHACHQLYYILSGAADFFIGDRHLAVGTGCCFLIPAQQPHRMLPVQRNPLQTLELKFYIRDPFLATHLLTLPEPISDCGTVQRLLGYVVENWDSQDAQNTKDIEYMLTTVLLSFFAHRLHYTQKDSAHILTDSYSSVTKDILVYIEKHFPHPFRLQTLGQALNYNKNYLCAVFTKNTGVSIIDYLNFVRIRRAVIFFAFYGQDVYTACESVGFTNLSHFSRTFKSLVGLPPRDFRKAFSLLSQEEASRYFTDEPFLSYRRCTMEDAFTSLHRSGQVATQILQNHPQA